MKRVMTEEDEAQTERVLANLQAYLESPRFASQCSKAKAAGQKLHDATILLSDSLAKFERVLVEKHGGKAAAIELDEDTALMFWKFGGKAGLYVLRDGNGPEPLLRTSRRTRVLAAEVLPDIVVFLTEEDEP